MAKQADIPSWASKVGRAGFAAKAVVYVTVGALAVLAATGRGGETTDSMGALENISGQPFGQVMLGVLALGLACYAVWRLLSAFADAEGKGGGLKGYGARAGFLASGLAHIGLAFGAAMLLLGRGSSGGSDDAGTQDMTAQVMEVPWGRWLVILGGIFMAMAGIMEWVKAAKGTDQSKMSLEGVAAANHDWVRRMSAIGHGARGVVFVLIGIFLAQAGWQSNAGKARGIAGALDALASQPYGPWLLGATALGLMAYGSHCALIAAYGRFEHADRITNI